MHIKKLRNALDQLLCPRTFLLFIIPKHLHLRQKKIGCYGCIKHPRRTGSKTVCYFSSSIWTSRTLESLNGNFYWYFIELFRNEVTVEKGIDLVVDAGYLTVTDPNPIDESEFKYVPPTPLL